MGKKNAIVIAVCSVLSIVLAGLSAKYSPGAYEALCSTKPAAVESAE
jgi:hypothetical protein